MPAVVAAISSVAAIFTGSSILAAVARLVVTFAISALIRSLQDKPRAVPFDNSLNITSTNPDTARQIIYGRTRVGGARVFAELSPDNQWLYLVNVIAGHEIESFDEIYFDDELLSINAQGDVLGNFSGHAHIETHLGTPDQTANAWLVGQAASWTVDCRLRGLAYIVIGLKFNPDIFPSVPNISAVIKGRKVYDQRDVSQTINAPSTWKWTDNLALCVQDYYRGVPFTDGAGNLKQIYGVNAPNHLIDFTGIAVEANISDEPVPLSAGGTQKRYTCNGVLNTETLPEEAVNSMLASGAGIRTEIGGVWGLQVGAARTIDAGLDFFEDDLIGPIRVQPKKKLRELFSGVKGLYRGAETDYSLADAPPFSDSALIAQDGRENWLEFSMPFTDNAAAAQRIQRALLSETRRQIRISVPLSLKALKLAGGDWFTFTSERRGWDHKIFRCVSWSFVISGDSSAPSIGISVEAMEIDSGIWAWNTSMEGIVPPLPSTNLPNPMVVPAPANLSVEVLGFTNLARVKLTAIPSSGPTVNYWFEYKLASELEWIALSPRTVPEAFLDLEVGNYVFRVRASVIPYGGQSPFTPNSSGLSFSVEKPPLTPRVTGLELVNGGPSGIFTGPDAQFRWREGSINSPSQDFGLDNPLGADAFQRDTFFGGFHVEIRSLSGVSLRVATVLDPSFIYTLDMNRRDSLRVLGTGPSRSFSITVWQIGKHGQETENSLPETLIVENPAPIAPSVLSVESFSRSGWIDFIPASEDGDLAGSILKASTTQGFDPETAGGVLFQGSVRSRISFAIDPGATLFLRVALFDEFGTDTLNWSSEQSVTSEAITSAEFDQALTDAFETAQALPGNYVLKLDVNGRITGFALIQSGGVAPETIAGFLVDKFLIAHPDVNGGVPIPAFIVEAGVVKINEAQINNLSVDKFKTVWASIDDLRSGRIRGPLATGDAFDINPTLQYIKMTA